MSAAGAEYSFKHELTREVAYNTILIARRRTLHSRALEVIEANFANRVDEHVDRKYGAAMAAAEAAYDIASKIGNVPLSFAALHNIGIIHHETGAFKKAVEVHRWCQAMLTPDLDAKRAGWASYPSVTLHTFLADSLPELGEIAEAEAMADEAVRQVNAVNHAYSRSLIYHIRARIHLSKGEVAAAVALMEEVWRICVDLEIIQMYPVTAARLGEAYLDASNIDAALKVIALPEQLDVPQAENNYG
jgi:tetratricopeptide (TPR) repeat protein